MPQGVRCSRFNIVPAAGTSAWKREGGCQVSNGVVERVRHSSGSVFCDKIVGIGLLKCRRDSALVSKKGGSILYLRETVS